MSSFMLFWKKKFVIYFWLQTDINPSLFSCSQRLLYLSPTYGCPHIKSSSKGQCKPPEPVPCFTLLLFFSPFCLMILHISNHHFPNFPYQIQAKLGQFSSRIKMWTVNRGRITSLSMLFSFYWRQECFHSIITIPPPSVFCSILQNLSYLFIYSYFILCIYYIC